jgi:hypothetical protein
MPSVVERMHEALNRHDLDAFLDCFDSGYQREQPAHPNRGFGTKEQVRKNSSAIFEGFPDLGADLLDMPPTGLPCGASGTGELRG